MGIPVLILGESGSGKSASLRNFQPDQVGIFNVGGKPLPFRSKLTKVDTDSYKTIMGGLSCMKTPSAVIDDAQYLMANEFMRRCKEVGFQKFTDMATSYWQLVQYVIKELPADRVVYFLSHIERDNNGNEKCKTIGKMLDEKITVEGMFTVVLKTHVQDGRYTFVTQTNGMDTVKSPMGMFDQLEIDNDLALVDKTIREYYGIETGGQHEQTA
jgi:hypothetical protein